MPDIKLYYSAIVIKTTWFWYSERQVNQWNKIEDPEMHPHTYGHLISDKGAKTIQWKKDRIFNKCCWHNWWLSCRRMQIDPFLSSCTKVESHHHWKERPIGLVNFICPSTGECQGQKVGVGG
jgi:hypothetical protein